MVKMLLKEDQEKPIGLIVGNNYIKVYTKLYFFIRIDLYTLRS